MQTNRATYLLMPQSPRQPLVERRPYNLLPLGSFLASKLDAGKNSHRRDLDCVGVAKKSAGPTGVHEYGRCTYPVRANDRRRGRTFVESSRDRIRALQGDLPRDVRTDRT